MVSDFKACKFSQRWGGLPAWDFSVFMGYASLATVQDIPMNLMIVVGSASRLESCPCVTSGQELRPEGPKAPKDRTAAKFVPIAWSIFRHTMSIFAGEIHVCWFTVFTSVHIGNFLTNPWTPIHRDAAGTVY